MSYTEFSGVAFGARRTGLSTVGYRLYNSDGTPNGARVTTGIAERAPGEYAATVTFPDNFTGEIRWDTGEGTPRYASDFINPKGTFGAGALAVTVTVTDGAMPLQNARVRLTEGVNSFTAMTNVSGVASFNVDAATYALAITKTGYFYSGSSIAITAAANFDAALDQVTIPAPADPDLATGFLTTRDAQGAAVAGIAIAFKMTAGPGTDSYRDATFSVTSDGAGLLPAPFVRGSKYQARRGSAQWVEFTVPDADTFDLPSVLGSP